jgi:murein DD-endopeptidase MepM/ murein hydrolase activator NlpD
VFLAVAEGTIEDNLYNSALANHIDPALILELADMFAWDINFFTDIRPGDHYRFIYEKIYIDGKFVRNGRILAAEFINQGRRYEAFFFQTEDGHADYYDENGKSLRKAFLKAPLRYKRISSYFSYHRRHPILGIVRPHLGIDYAAPIGTPVEAVADGRIVYIGWRGGYGKFIKIQHNHIYASTYGHLSRFAKGLRRGSWVKQGQVIGYVGSTGRSTGPHLHYELRYKGKRKNPLTWRLPKQKRVAKSNLKRFQKKARAILRRL